MNAAPATSPVILPDDIRDKSLQEIRALASRLGLLPDNRWPDRSLDPVTLRERLRVDPGHRDPVTAQPYRNIMAAVPHVHAYPPGGPRVGQILDFATADAHFPLR